MFFTIDGQNFLQTVFDFQFHCCFDGCFIDFDEINLKTTKLLELSDLRKIGPNFAKLVLKGATTVTRFIL